MNKIPDITVTSLETITAFDILTGNYMFTLDELQNATIGQTQDKQEITGKQGRKIANMKRNKAITVSGTNGLLSHGLMEMQTGGKFEHKTTEVLWADYLEVGEENKATTSYKAIGTTGAEIESLLVKKNGVPTENLEQAEQASEGKFAYNPTTKVLTFHTDIAVGTEIVVYYKRKMVADTMDNESDVYSKKCMLYVDALAEDKCSNVYRVQFFIPKADFNGEFSIEMGDNQSVHAFEAESLAGACGAGSKLWNYTIFGVDTEDAA